MRIRNRIHGAHLLVYLSAEVDLTTVPESVFNFSKFYILPLLPIVTICSVR